MLNIGDDADSTGMGGDASLVLIYATVLECTGEFTLTWEEQGTGIPRLNSLLL